ncbi:nucleoside deaminase [Porphyromonas circumdentaria]|uniref:tRNA-specific adenosine deaminase n=1 Tax=Porphyromonas circumdentaria TaxID=29524 RepID=A0A1T4KQD1_9PORP|nr:nucleoside deaminase [Porphyromonas circumdentaria]MBB6274949.1 tRNA(adenine34) deaminase [Porphyromonas circumdentaria]MDO4722219.1 nucleoside deaminase [Porphyromonas circumdentaria]SJZ44558.1 tRNA(adenine34) deaminase [Porphyromonas circumdentaria]
MERLFTYDDNHWMRLALQEARLAFEQGEVPIGAVVVANNKPIAQTHNQVELLKDPTAHAELLAITAATEALGGKYLTDCTLYVTLEPCIMCIGALRWAQIGHIVYGASDPKGGYNRWAPLAPHPKTKITAGILEREAQKLLTTFFQQRR